MIPAARLTRGVRQRQADQKQTSRAAGKANKLLQRAAAVTSSYRAAAIFLRDKKFKPGGFYHDFQFLPLFQFHGFIINMYVGTFPTDFNVFAS